MARILFLNLLFFVAALFIVTSCSSDEDTVALSDIIELQVVDYLDSYPADGNTEIKVKAFLPGKAAEANRSVTFRTNIGKFKSNGEKEFTTNAKVLDNDTDNLVAETILIAPTSPGMAEVVGVVKDFTSELVSLEFKYAEALSLGLSISHSATPNDYSVDALIEGILRSANGVPSTGTKVEFHVEKEVSPNQFVPVPDDELILRNIDVTTDVNGKVSTFFNGSNLGYVGRLRIVCNVENSTIADSVYLQLFNP